MRELRREPNPIPAKSPRFQPTCLSIGCFAKSPKAESNHCGFRQGIAVLKACVPEAAGSKFPTWCGPPPLRVTGTRDWDLVCNFPNPNGGGLGATVGL